MKTRTNEKNYVQRYASTASSYSNTKTKGENMKALETVKLIEVTLVLSIETYGAKQMFCGMDYITVHDDAQVLGCSERDLEVKPIEGQ